MGAKAAEQGPQTRNRTLGGSVTPKEHGEILESFDKAGMPNASRAARAVLLSFSRCPEVRDAVAEYLRDNMEILAA